MEEHSIGVADYGRCVEISNHEGQVEVHLHHPKIAIAAFVGLAPSSRGSGEVVVATTAGTDSLIDFAFLVEAAGTAVHMLA